MRQRGDLAQMVRASDSYPEGPQFNSGSRYQQINYRAFANLFVFLKRYFVVGVQRGRHIRIDLVIEILHF